ncbi:radical SAM family heme chaperone HemW [Phenylobacterium sp.]|uniref:radical SAM family heme chaperone HemW n=1 Tax=Phenylobacterium sp. TaxID=1871053 RepID=UPI002FDA0348
MTAEAPPLGLYVHWPYCARICPYCDFNVYRARGRGGEAQDLAGALLSDLAAQAALTGPRRLVSIFFGGGTPSLAPPELVADIIARARSLWRADADLEISLEANPTDAEARRFADFAAAGVNRLSLGVQSFDDAALAFLGRDHDAAAARRALALAADLFPRLSLDLIYARPDQSRAAWAAELGEALASGAEHISPYQLTIEPGTAFARALARGRLVPPDEDHAAALFDDTQDILQAAGFEAYEVSNHARGEAARARHNLVYWQGWDYAGIGPGAHGRLTLGGVRHALEGLARPADYIARVGESGAGFAAVEPLDPVAKAEERVLSGLRIDAGLAYSEVTVLGLSPQDERVMGLVELGMLADDPQRLRATRAGRLLLDEVTRRLLL